MEDVKEIKEEKEPRTTKQKVFFGLEIAGNVVFYLLIIALFLFALFNINGGNGTENFPNLFGKGMLNVLSPSMDHEGKEGLDEWKDTTVKDGFATGDLLWASTFSDDTTENLKLGDVIIFASSVNGSPALVTHRIVDFTQDGKIMTQGDKVALELSTKYINGKLLPKAHIAKGTARYNEAIAAGMTDEEISAFNYTYQNSYEIISLDAVRGVVTSVSAGSGSVLENIQKNYLFYFVLPVAALLIFEIFLVVRNIMILRGEKNKAELEGTREALMADVEAEKEKMRQELLAEMRAQGLVTSDQTVEETKEEPEVSTENNEEVNDDASKAVVAEEMHEELTEDNKEVVEETAEEEKEENTTEEDKTSDEE